MLVNFIFSHPNDQFLQILKFFMLQLRLLVYFSHFEITLSHDIEQKAEMDSIGKFLEIIETNLHIMDST